MDVTKMLETDHREVEQIFAKLERAKGARRQSLVDDLAMSLRAHMELEETVVYPEMEPVTGHEDVQEGVTEHTLARKTLEDVVRLAPDDPGFGAALDSLKAGITHHVKEEEQDVFPKVRKDASVLEAIATPFIKKRVELGMPVGADALAAASSKDELLAEAEAASVDGASALSKEELAEALVQKMS